MSDTPRARELLKVAALLIDLAEELLHKEKPVYKPAAKKSATMTPALGEEIRRYKQKFPDRQTQEIAQTFGVNPGRVSEALHGKWK